MSLVRSKLEESQATRVPFAPTTLIPQTDVQRAIESVLSSIAPATAQYLVGASDGTLTAERVVTNTTTIEWDLATAGQAKANWLGLVTDTDPELGGGLDLNSFDITGTGNINHTGTITSSGYATVNGGAVITGGALATQFAAKGVYIGTETNGNEQFNIISTGTYGYFDIGGINEDYKMRFLVAIASGNTVLDAAGTLAFTTGGAVSFNQAVAVPDDAYAVGWDGSANVPTKNAVYDKIELILGTTLPATYQPLDSDLTSWAGVTRASGFDTFAATPSLANFGSLLTDEGTGVITALGVNVGTAGAFVVNGGALGTPSSGTLTNATGLPTAGLVNDAVTFAKMQNITSDRLIGRDTASSGDPEEISLGASLEWSGSSSIQRAALTGAIAASANSNTTTSTFDLVFVIDGGGSTITTGVKGDFHADFAFTMTAWTILADQSGAIQIDVWKDTYTNFPPDNSDSMTNSHEIIITASGSKAQDTDLSDWTTTSVAAGDVIRLNVDSVTSHQRVTISIKCTKTS